jgi:hypothetical protein
MVGVTVRESTPDAGYLRRVVVLILVAVVLAIPLVAVLVALVQVSDERDQLRVDLSEAKIDEEDLEELEHEVTRLENELEEQRSESERAEANLRGLLDTERTEAKQLEAQLRADLEARLAQVADAEQKVTELEAELQARQAEGAAIQAELQAELDAAIAEHKDRLEELRVQLDKAERVGSEGILGAVWRLELRRAARRWRNLAAPFDPAPIEVPDDVAAGISAFLDWQAEHLREEVGTPTERTGDEPGEITVATGLILLQICGELLEHLGRRCATLEVLLVDTTVVIIGDGWEADEDEEVVPAGLREVAAEAGGIIVAAHTDRNVRVEVTAP